MPKKKKPSREQPVWVCYGCGDTHRAGKWYAYSTWHGGMCGVCHQPKPVTEPRDCGYLLPSWMTHKHD